MSKHMLALVLPVLLACSRSTTTKSSDAAPAGASQGDVAGQQALAQIEDDWAKALQAHDTTFFTRVLAPDFHGTGDSAKTFGRADMIRDAADTSVRVRDLHDEDREIRIYGDGTVGVVTGFGHWTVQKGDSSSQQSGRYTEVYVKRGGNWQAVAGHYSNGPMVAQPPRQ
jgi:ketosteroid isomerase-like protein